MGKTSPGISKWGKSIKSWQVNGVLYISMPFTWLYYEAIRLIRTEKLPTIIGGPGALLIRDKFEGIAEVQETTIYEPVVMHNPFATFTTRGCPNKCKFCAVPKIEGDFREIRNFTPRPIVCDNNFLASSKRHFNRVIDLLKPFPFVDFNQGLDATKFTNEVAGRLAELPHLRLHFAFDDINKESSVIDAITIARKNGMKDIRVLVLYGFNEEPSEALYKAELLRKHKVSVFPMRYQPLNTLHRNAFISPKWTEYELQRFSTYWIKARNGIMDKVPFSEFEMGKMRRNRKGLGIVKTHKQFREESNFYKEKK